ncbi:hypothetical protein EB796_013383 [Bugula neritina]|uniref:Uncharacterized protein n=1 Tax=Bugula neritina TaxID=10212 RepID=A0A7J7JPQ1_BUGNE|nr:hypothetical protein EB796_013383 [Bugula neritina]
MKQRCSSKVLTGLLLLASILCTSHAARRYMRKPGKTSVEVTPQASTRFSASSSAGSPTVTESFTTASSLNVGELSNAILSAVRPSSSIRQSDH